MAKDVNTRRQTAPDAAPPLPQAPEGWETESTGFPPYWSPAPGKTFQGVILALDERDPEFVRFLVRATVQVEACRGPSQEQEPVAVAVGDMFNVSDYFSLPLRDCIGLEVWVHVRQKREIPNGRSLWDFDLKLKPEHRLMLAQRRAEGIPPQLVDK